MKILLVKSVFCPNKEYLDITIKSLIKTNIFIEFIQKKYDYIEFDLLLIGWVNKYKQLFDTAIKLNKLFFDDIYFDLWTINYGKYKMLNNTIDFVNDCDINYKYILYLDHDVHFYMKNLNLFDSIKDLDKLEINEKKLGLVAFNQKEDCRHQLDIYENTYQYLDLDLLWSNKLGSIASGGFIISIDAFKLLKEFDLITVYGLDDYKLTEQLDKNGLLNVVIHNIYIIHPNSHNVKYEDWKKNNIKKIINNKISSYYETIQDSINFWNIRL